MGGNCTSLPFLPVVHIADIVIVLWVANKMIKYDEQEKLRGSSSFSLIYYYLYSVWQIRRSSFSLFIIYTVRVSCKDAVLSNLIFLECCLSSTSFDAVPVSR